MKRLCFLLLLGLAACGQSQNHAWLGYAEGDNVFIAAPQAGWIADMPVERGSAVKPGDLLFRLDDTRERAARDQAQATLSQMQHLMAQQEASLEYAQKELMRQQGLARAHAGVAANLDLAQSNFKQAQALLAQTKAQERQAEAVLANAQYQLDQRRVVAYVQGRVEDIYFRKGEYAPASTPALSVLPAKNIYVRFFVPETDLAHTHLGQKVQIGCDGCKPIVATVTFIAQQEEYTPPVIFSVGNREKLVFKVEARAPGGLALNPGQPVDVTPVQP